MSPSPPSSWSWRHRFYAFLLRRALGPFLTSHSAADLHRSIHDIDWAEGTVAVGDVEFDPVYLTRLLHGAEGGNHEANDGNGGGDKSASNMAVYRARVRRFAIRLGVRDVDPLKNGEATGGTARKATSALLQNMFGTNSDEGEGIHGLALVAHVELDGVEVILAPGRSADATADMEWSTEPTCPRPTTDQPLTPKSAEGQEAATPGFFSSLVDAAMKSLRLSIDVADVTVRACSEYGTDSDAGDAENACWVSVNLASARYYDLIDAPQNNGERHSVAANARRDGGTREKLTISKALDWQGIVVDSGGGSVGRSSATPGPSPPMFQSPGGGQLRFRVYETWSKTKAGAKAVFASARQDIEVSLRQRMAVELDLSSMTRVICLANAITSFSDEDGDFVDAYEEDAHRIHDEASDDAQEQRDQALALADEFSRETYEEVMKQYTEARHLARTRELRGGLLIPSFDERSESNNDIDAGDISFDAFFDANDHSVGHYCSMMEESVMEGEGGPSNGESSRHGLEQTKVELGVEEFTIKVHIRSPAPHGSTSLASVERSQSEEYILLSMGDLRVIVFGSDEESKVNCSVSHFDIESQVCDGHGAIVNEPLLRFGDDPSGGDDLLVSSPPCISMMAEFSKADDEAQAKRFDVVLQPLEIIFQEQALRRLSDVLATMPEIDCKASEEDQESNPTSIHLSLSSSSIMVMVPCHQGANKMLDTEPNPLFQRHGYRDLGCGGSKFSGLGIELDNIAVDISQSASVADTTQTSSEESKAVMACTHIILFAKGTELERGRRRNRKLSSYISRRSDIMAFTGDEDGESPVTISFATLAQKSAQSKRVRKRKSAFPIILPLSATKARQEEDDSDDEMDHLYDDACGPSGIETSDPQYVLSSEANEAKRELVIDIPNFFFDSTSVERQGLSDLLSNVHSGESEVASSSTDPTHLNDSNLLLGLALNVGQASIVLHGSPTDGANSYSLIMDKLQIHTLIASSGVRNVRFLSHDVTLYELSNHFCSGVSLDTMNQHPTSCAERCQLVRRRLAKGPSTLARAILFRQKLCQSLSPETPAFLVDVLKRGDDECGEMSAHVNIFDMTYRYVMNSDWIQNITKLIKGEQDEVPSNEQSSTEDEVNAIETSSSLTNLFVNLADCNFDYTPPPTFRNPSRVILRVGEIRFTSNIVTPAASIQAYKLSLSDFRLHICSYRHSYNEENSLLSCAHRHLDKGDLFVPEAARCLGRNVVGLDDALCRMDFVNLLVLDTLDAVIFKTNHSTNNRRQKDPATTVALTLGKLSIYACHDSFSCLMATYNEWFIKSTALSEEEIERLRALSDTESDVGISTNSDCLLPLEEHPSPTMQPKELAVARVAEPSSPTQVSSSAPPAPTQQHQHRDDTVSLDLTKSLLFQNYYTFDAKNNRQDTGPPHVEVGAIKRTEEDMSLSPRSEDEWAAVEHDFLQHSNIPPQRDQSAGWILCDSPSAESPKTASLPIHSQKVKVYPQHIPVKPILDPFAEDTVDTAKLAGTDVAPDIATRVIVKDGSITFRFFDGFDWVKDAPQFHQPKAKPKPKNRKAELLGDLLGGDEPSDSPLDISPLPEERSKTLQREIARKKLRRNAHKYFQISMDGLRLKQDGFAESMEHQLASCLDLSINDFFIAETISMGDPVKMMGEWVNESEHPRDNNDGVIMLKTITKHPKLRVSSDGKLMSDESRATLELLPLRCYFNQNALRFVRGFFAGSASETEDEEEGTEEDDSENDVVADEEIINIFFESFKVRPCKLKVDYQPENMDIDSFRDGNYIEILNLCPLEEMILTLQPVEMQDLTGWGSVFSEMAGRWIEDICATQAHKFFTRASPFQPFSNLGDPLADLALVLVIPEGGVVNYFKGIVGGTTKFAGKVALEALSTSAKLTRFAANQLNTKALPSTGLRSSLPRRPRSVPRHAGDAVGHAYESVASGLREANYKIVTVPLREYQNAGAGGAARSALKGIPIGVIAPIAGASEALSYTLLGLRNQLRPDIRKEEEASLRGLNEFMM